MTSFTLLLLGDGAFVCSYPLICLMHSLASFIVGLPLLDRILQVLVNHHFPLGIVDSTDCVRGVILNRPDRPQYSCSRCR